MNENSFFNQVPTFHGRMDQVLDRLVVHIPGCRRGSVDFVECILVGAPWNNVGFGRLSRRIIAHNVPRIK